jgi:glycine/D-amino acid oxidase-like deaminating enzyme
MASYPIFKMMADDPELSLRAGVRMIKSDFFFSYSLDDHPEQHAKMVEIMNAGVHGFRRDPGLLRERNVSSEYQAVDAYEFQAPVIDTDTAMAFLMEMVERKGAKFVTEQIRGDLLDQEAELCSRFGADIIVNATGLSGAELASDGTCYPLRGGVIRLINDGSDFPKVETAMVMSAQAVQDPNDIIFIVPRNENILLLGSITQPHEWDLDLSMESDMVKRMRSRSEKFYPPLKNARVDPEYPLAQGLRPFRSTNVRVERDQRWRRTPGEQTQRSWNRRSNRFGRPRSRIVHSYGHGGAGWTLSFGCAGDVAALVQEVLLELQLQTLSDPPDNLRVMSKL